jgi:hypothetical protein
MNTYPHTRKKLVSRKSQRYLRLAVSAVVIAAFALGVLLTGSPAHAQLSQSGPIDPNTGFPFWYEDSKGVRLGYCLDPGGICLQTLPDPNQPPFVAANAADSNFPSEAFYWNATSDLTGTNGVTGLLVLGLEGAFEGQVQQGGQLAFSRVRMRIDNLVQGASYRITYPYGREEFDDVNAGVKGINFTEDIGIGNFPNGPLAGHIDPFLTWDTYGLPVSDGGPPLGFVGDPAVDHLVAGSPFTDSDGQLQNYFRIERIDPVTREVLEVVGQQDLFSVQGKIAGLGVAANPRGGVYGADVSVSLVASDPLATIFYTLTTDGSLPSDPSVPGNAARVQYTAPILMPFNTAVTTNLRYVAVLGSQLSPVVLETYTFANITPGTPPPQPPLARVGPIDPNTGFPFWYEDITGMRMGYCLDPVLCGNTLPNPALPPLVAADEADSNFPPEMFYWAGDARVNGTGGVTARLVLALEAAFAGRVQQGQQITFGRVRIRIDNLVDGATYRITHPYGVDEFDNVTGGARGINFTEDIGLASFPNGALRSRIGPFLAWDTWGLSPDQGGPPIGFLGDPAVDHAVVGSPFLDSAGDAQNYFKIERIDPDTRQVIAVVGETDQFSIQGRIEGQYAAARPRGGAYTQSQTVTLFTPDPTSEIFYTLDGTDPVPDVNGLPFVNPITITLDAAAIDSTKILKFIVVDINNVSSQVFTEVYRINPGVSVPTLDAASDTGDSNTDGITNLTTLTFVGTAITNSTVTLFVDGVAAGSSVAVPPGVFQITAGPLAAGNHTVFATATTPGGITGTSASGVITIDLTAPGATATPPGQNFNSPFSVSLTASEAATIFFTTDGGTPTTSSTVYTVSIPISVTTTLKFIARDVAGNVSGVFTQTYTFVPPSPPAAPTNLTLNASVKGQISLHWVDNSNNETSFSIERSLSGTTGFAVIASVGINVIDFADSTTVKNTTYFYRVRAINNVGASAYSNTASARAR